MGSPFPPSFSTPGGGHVVVKALPNGESGLEQIAYQYPLKLIAPPHPTERQSVLVFLLSYGGGLVAGDRVDLKIEVHAGARLSVVTQGHTKIFKSPSPTVVTRQALDVHIGPGAAVCLLPDPVQPFGESVYEQTQVFRLAGPDASLCMLDWVTQGRAALGENWSFGRWIGRNEVWTAAPAPAASPRDNAPGRLLVRDAVILDRDGAQRYSPSLRETMHGLGVFGTLILRGPLVKSLAEFFLAEFAALPRLGARDFRTPEARQEEEQRMTPLEKWRRERLEMERASSILWSAANVRGCVLIKFGAAAVEAGRLWLGSMIAREGSLARNFGQQALICLR